MATPCNCDTFTSDVTITNAAAPQLVILGGGTASARLFPQGGGNIASVEAFSTDDPTLASFSRMRMTVDGNTAGLFADAGGSGVAMPLALSAGGSERLRVTTAGNVGIGTTSPQYPLDVPNGVARVYYLLATDHLAVTVGSFPRLQSDVAGTPLYVGASNAPSGNVLVVAKNDFSQPANQLLAVANNGYVGIGTTSPEALLHLNGGGLLVSGDASIQGRYYCVSRLIADSAGSYYAD